MFSSNEKALASGRVKIKNGFDTTLDNGQEDLESLSIADGGNTVKEGGSGGGADHGAEGGDESRQEDTKGNVENGFKPHVKGGGDSQPYDGHRWGLGCLHFVSQVPEEVPEGSSDRYQWLGHLNEISYVLQVK